MNPTRAELTFKHNRNQGRHGWLRLTPAYSVNIVSSILDQHPSVRYVLDPFSGTGTTGLVCAERGVDCDLLELNPFLVWLAKAKTATYSSQQIEEAQAAANRVVEAALLVRKDDLWTPPISNISRWWAAHHLDYLARIHQSIHEICFDPLVRDLLLVAFCRVLIDWSNAAFNHQSMSFKDPRQPNLFDSINHYAAEFLNAAAEILRTVQTALSGRVVITQADAREIPPPANLYDCVITSPPYPNRFSYVRELRPYMYWLGYLKEAREAGELDWQAIGGTWGIATSRLNTWQSSGQLIQYPNFSKLIGQISNQSQALANYVHRYFEDIAAHIQSLQHVLCSTASIYYVVGNSKFYNVVLPVEEIYAALFEQFGFEKIAIEIIRKRNSKKELYEFIVSAKMP